MAPRKYAFDPFEYERSGEVRILRKDGVRLKIQGQPLEVLECLIERPGQIVSRQDLRERLWSGDVHVDFDRCLNAAMKRLRAALDDDPSQPRFIETVARTGYVFIAPVAEAAEAAPVAPEAKIQAEIPAEIPPAVVQKTTARRWFLASGVAALSAAAGAGAYVWKRRAQDLQLRRLSFETGSINNVFFTADGESVIYSAHWSNGDRWQTYLHKLDEPHAKPLPFDGMAVAAVSPANVLLLFDFARKPGDHGAIVRASLDGAAPKLLDEHVMSVDWTDDSKHFACVRFDGADDRVEFPAGRTIHNSAGNLGPVRVAPTDSTIAVLEHDVRGDTGGYVLLLESGRTARKLMDRWPHMISIGWHPSGQEVWFTGSRDGTTTALWAVDRAGNLRMVGLPGMADSTFDIHRNGRVTFIKNHARMESGVQLPGENEAREISHLGWSRVVGLSNRGEAVLFDETAEGVGNRYRGFLYYSAEKRVKDLGPGLALAISPGAEFALLLQQDHRDRLVLVRLSDGQRTDLASRGWIYETAAFFPDAQRIAACARPLDRPNAPSVIIVHDVNGGPVSVLPFSERVGNVRVAPDGSFVAAGRQRLAKWTQWDSRPETIEPQTPANLIGFAPDGRFVVRAPAAESGPVVQLYALAGGGRFDAEPLFELRPPDERGILRLNITFLSPDGTAAAYVAHRSHSELFLAEGLR